MFNQFNIFTTDKDLTGLDDTISAFIKKLNKKAKADKASKAKKALNLLVNHRKVLKGFRCFCQKGHGGSGGSGKKIKDTTGSCTCYCK